MKIICSTGEVVTNYADYLTTHHWRELRVLSFHKANGRCKICNRYLTHNFVCHHVSTGAYKRIGRERLNKPVPKLLRMFFGTHWQDDVIAVCVTCHDGKSKTHIKLHQNIIVPSWARKN